MTPMGSFLKTASFMSQFTLFPGILVAFRFQVSGKTEASGVRFQVSGVRKEKRKNCAVLKANAANLTPDT